MKNNKKLKLGVLVSHPIQYFVPVYRELAKDEGVDLMVLYRTRVGLDEYYDEGFGQTVKWDIQLVDGYPHYFLSNKNKIAGVEWNVIRELFCHRFDVLMVHGYSSVTNLLAIFVARMLGTKVLMRGDTRAQAHHDKANLRVLFKRTLFKLCNGFVTIGELNRAYYQQHGVSSGCIYFAPFCVQNEHFSVLRELGAQCRKNVRFELGLEAESLIILFASKLIRRKRADDLIRAFALLTEVFPAVCLVIAGSGEEEQSLRQLAVDTGVKQIRFLGFQNQKQLPLLYAASDIFVLPADSEPWGLVVNEVMAAGLPVIVSHEVGAAPDLVEGKGTGIVYPCGNVLALFEALRLLITHPELREQMAGKAVDLISRWDVKACATGILQATEAVASKNSVHA